MTNAECSPYYQPYNPLGISPSQFCAASSDSDAAKGDSGGPVITDVKGSYYLAGIVCAGIPGSPGIYSRVQYVMDWINLHLNGNICKP